MLYCNNCGAITKGIERNEMIEGFLRPYMICSECGSDDLVEASKCKICGEYGEPTIQSECEDCREELFEMYWIMLQKLEEEFPGADRGDIIEGMMNVIEDFYNKYRFK